MSSSPRRQRGGEKGSRVEVRSLPRGADRLGLDRFGEGDDRDLGMGAERGDRGIQGGAAGAEVRTQRDSGGLVCGHRADSVEAGGRQNDKAPPRRDGASGTIGRVGLLGRLEFPHAVLHLGPQAEEDRAVHLADA